MPGLRPGHSRFALVRQEGAITGLAAAVTLYSP
jgi:hypothetical protein